MELDIKLSSTVYYDKIDGITDAGLLHNETPLANLAKAPDISGAMVLHIRHIQPGMYLKVCFREVGKFK